MSDSCYPRHVPENPGAPETSPPVGLSGSPAPPILPSILKHGLDPQPGTPEIDPPIPDDHDNIRRLRTRLRQAKLKQPACMEDIDYRQPRGLDKSMTLGLADCHWVKDRLNILLTGPAGVGKTWLACAFAHKACQSGHTALYYRLPRLLQSLSLARGDGSYAKVMTRLARTGVLILDDCD